MLNTQKNLGVIYIGEIIPYITGFNPVLNAQSFFKNPKTSQHRRFSITIAIDDSIEEISKKLNDTNFFNHLFTPKDVKKLLNGKNFEDSKLDVAGCPGFASGKELIELACFKKY